MSSVTSEYVLHLTTYMYWPFNKTFAIISSNIQSWKAMSDLWHLQCIVLSLVQWFTWQPVQHGSNRSSSSFYNKLMRFTLLPGYWQCCNKPSRIKYNVSSNNQMIMIRPPYSGDMVLVEFCPVLDRWLSCLIVHNICQACWTSSCLYTRLNIISLSLVCQWVDMQTPGYGSGVDAPGSELILGIKY